MNLIRLAILLACLVLVGTVEARATPLPDSAVGQHKAVKVKSHKRGYWITTTVRGRAGLWRCFIPPHYRYGTPVRCSKL